MPSDGSELRLDTSVQFIKGVGAVRAGQLAQLGIRTLEDLLTYFPRRFDLRPQVQPIAALSADQQNATVAGEVGNIRENRFGRVPVFQCILTDATGKVAVRWFHGSWLRDRIKPGLHIAVSGPVSTYKGRLQLVNPRHQVIWGPAATDLETDELLPVYPASGQLSSGHIARIIQGVLPLAATLIRPWFDAEYLCRRNLMNRPAAVAAMHRPEDKVHWAQARRRLAYDECLLMQLGIGLTRLRQVSRPAHGLVISPAIDERIRARFPFGLTAAQDKAVGEIVADLGRDRPMNRLLQGDVGSGKTVVALYAALLAVARGKQAAIMAPTEILAGQHYRTISALFSDGGEPLWSGVFQPSYLGRPLRVTLLTGSLAAKDKAAAQEAISRGEVDIAIGTHALIQEEVSFPRLGLVVVDEQHRFGVMQRAALRAKGGCPHLLVMTATPIPRTLALTVYGDLDMSLIDEMPPGRKRVKTIHVLPHERDETYGFVREQVQQGRQAYIICPLVEESEAIAAKAAVQEYEYLAREVFPDLRLGLVHGRVPAVEREVQMRAFRDGRLDILVATAVVEVGIDVANATVMLVEGADRFGLSQLHQFRGRVGRGEHQSYCILLSENPSEEAQERLRLMESIYDGFRLAEEDLRLRGPGEYFGTRQTGLPDLKVARLSDVDLLEQARAEATRLLEGDPALARPEHRPLAREVSHLWGRLTAEVS